VYNVRRGDYVIRIDLSITDAQKKWLEEQSKKLGIGKSELVRRILDREMKRK